MSPPPQTPRFRRWRFLGALAITVLVVATSLSILITAGLYGWPLLPNGLATCGVLAQTNRLETLLHTSCGCALVLLVFILLAAVGVWRFLPRLLRQMAVIRDWQNKHLGR